MGLTRLAMRDSFRCRFSRWKAQKIEIVWWETLGYDRVHGKEEPWHRRGRRVGVLSCSTTRSEERSSRGATSFEVLGRVAKQTFFDQDGRRRLNVLERGLL